MVLSNMVRVQSSGTNVTVNIPKQIREMLNISGGDTLMIEANREKKEIKLRKVEN